MKGHYDAKKDKKGGVRLVTKYIFLDEVSNTSILCSKASWFSKKGICSIGGTTLLKLMVRILAPATKDLKKLVQEGVTGRFVLSAKVIKSTFPFV
jgi:transcriptional regulator with PAS, ATPase and Fis domain